MIQAWSGLMSVTGTPETAPLKAGPPIVDYSTGIAAAFAVATALYQRTLTGKGQHIDLSMLDTMLVLMASVTTAYLNTGVAPKAKLRFATEIMLPPPAGAAGKGRTELQAGR